MSTVPPTQAVSLAKRVRDYRGDLALIDCPVSGGTPRAAIGDLMILASGLEDGGAKAQGGLSVLKSLSGACGNHSNLVLIPGGVGNGSAIKLVNQHLAGQYDLLTTSEGSQ